MPQIDIGSASESTVDYFTDYDVSSLNTDAGDGSGEYRYTNTNWASQLGYYKTIPELKIAVDTKAEWVLGCGFEADEMTQVVLDLIRGKGKESFNSILENMERSCYVGEDAYAEIITNDEDRLINLKVLDAGSITVVHDGKGMILRYEQMSKINKGVKRSFSPDKIFVLSNDRIADEVHGVSVVDAVENIILMRNEAMSDWRRVLHRNIDPLWIFHLDTDDVDKIATFKGKMDSARGKGENMYIPKGAVVPELVTTSPNASLNPLNWINQLNDYFFQAVGVPQIIVGNAKAFTDASAKIVYLAFEQRIKSRQKYVEEQVANQLNLEINLVFPASLQQDSVSARPSPNDVQMGVKSEPLQRAIEPNDQEASLGGRS